MTAEVIETERGPAVLLPRGWDVSVSSISVHTAGPNALLVSFRTTSTATRIEGYFDGPYYDNGLVAPEDLPPEPVPSF